MALPCPEIISIAAVAGNGVIGNNNIIPWPKIAEDMKKFQKFTFGNIVIMGRKTYDSLPTKYKPLPDRTNIVLTRNPGFQTIGVITSNSIDSALETAASIGREIYIIGGQQVYEQTMNIADRLEITEVKGNYDGDAFFPEINKNIWREVNRDKRVQYAFVTYQRIRQNS